jgi:hypothetical protein
MSTDKPIKRNEDLKFLSRDHHHALMLCWKIRVGIKKDIVITRIKKYADWFYKIHMLPHFDVEEKFIFTILGSDHEWIKKAIAEHRSITRLFESTLDTQKDLNRIADELESHIRFEERVLFNEIQKQATAEQLESIRINHSDEKFTDNLTDPFWE